MEWGWGCRRPGSQRATAPPSAPLSPGPWLVSPSPGRQRHPPAQQLPGENPRGDPEEQRDVGQEAAGQRAPGAQEHQVGTPGRWGAADGGRAPTDPPSPLLPRSMKRAASLNYLHKSSDASFEVRDGDGAGAGTGGARGCRFSYVLCFSGHPRAPCGEQRPQRQQHGSFLPQLPARFQLTPFFRCPPPPAHSAPRHGFMGPQPAPSPPPLLPPHHHGAPLAPPRGSWRGGGCKEVP